MVKRFHSYPPAVEIPHKGDAPYLWTTETASAYYQVLMPPTIAARATIDEMCLRTGITPRFGELTARTSLCPFRGRFQESVNRAFYSFPRPSAVEGGCADGLGRPSCLRRGGDGHGSASLRPLRRPSDRCCAPGSSRHRGGTREHPVDPNGRSHNLVTPVRLRRGCVWSVGRDCCWLGRATRRPATPRCGPAGPEVGDLERYPSDHCWRGGSGCSVSQEPRLREDSGASSPRLQLDSLSTQWRNSRSMRSRLQFVERAH